MGPVEAVAAAVALEEFELGDPVKLSGQLHGVFGQTGEDGLPAVEDVLVHLVLGGAALFDVLAGLFEVFHLQLDGGELAAVAHRDLVAAGGVVGDGAQGLDGVVDGQVAGEEAVFDHGKDERRRP